MHDPEPLPDNDIDVSNRLLEEDRASRFVVDFTVGPPGVGPVTSVTPYGRESSEHQPPLD